jgi:hypothetical protein
MSILFDLSVLHTIENDYGSLQGQEDSQQLQGMYRLDV